MLVTKKILFLFAQIFFCVVCIAQTPQTDRLKIDSLKKVLPSLHDSARIDCLNAIFKYWMFNDSFKYYVDMAYAEAIQINYIPGIAEAVNNKAVTEMLRGNYSNAEKLSRESLLWYDRTSNKTNITATFLTLGSVLKSQSSFLEAMSYLEKAYEYSKKAGDEVKMFLALDQLGSSYMESGDYGKAFDRYKESLHLTFKIDNEYWIVIQLEHLGQLYREIEDYNIALAYFRQAYQRIKAKPGFDYYGFAELFSLTNQFDSAKYYYSFIDTTGHPDSRLLVSLSEYYFLQKQFDKALDNALRALPLLRKSSDRNQLIRALLDIAKIYSATSNYDASFQYAKEGLMMAHQTGARHLILDGYQILYSVYDNWHKTDSAYFYYRHYVSLKDSILTDQIKGKLVAYSYEQRIALLGKEKLINQQQLNIQHQHLENESLLRDILIIAIIVVLLLSFIIFRNLILKRRNEKLENEKAQIEFQRNLADISLTALRFQMNPHFIFNCLNSIKLYTTQNDTETASAYLSKFSKLIRLVMDNANKEKILLSSELDTLRLYIEMEAMRFKEKLQYKINVAKDVETDYIELPPLLLQPYIENSIWHGLMPREEGGRIDIDIAMNSDKSLLEITIADDGIGRVKSAELKSKTTIKHKSYGMKVTSERIALINQVYKTGADVTVHDLVDADGKSSGTKVIIQIPA